MSSAPCKAAFFASSVSATVSGSLPRSDANQFKASHDDRQQIVEIMCYPAGKLSDRLHFLRLNQLLFDLLTTLDFSSQGSRDCFPSLDLNSHRLRGGTHEVRDHADLPNSRPA